MLNQFSRTELLFGTGKMEKLKKSRVIVFGVGGVGGYVVEALARSGVGTIAICDDDKVSLTNINRQIIATLDTVGLYKVDVMEKRIHSINPECNVEKYKCFFLPETEKQFDFSKYDYIVDAIDTVKGKIALVVKANNSKTKIISSMGAGNKVNPTMFEVSDIYKTSVCPLARVMRQELKKLRIKKLKVVFSKEVPIKPLENINDKNELVTRTNNCSKVSPGSNAFVPSVCGLIIASEVIKDLMKE